MKLLDEYPSFQSVWDIFVQKLNDEPTVISHFNNKLKEKLQTILNTPVQNRSNELEKEFFNLVAEFHATYILRKCLGLQIREFDRESPKGVGNKNCDIVACVNGEDVYFEVKSESAEIKQVPPDCLKDAIKGINDPDYDVVVSQLKNRDYKCENIEGHISQIKQFIADYKNRKYPRPLLDLGDFEIVLRKQFENYDFFYLRTPNLDKKIEKWLFEGKDSAMNKAKAQGADFLMGCIHPWDCCYRIDDFIRTHFPGIKAIDDHFESNNQILGNLQGVILFGLKATSRDNINIEDFKIVYNANYSQGMTL